MQANDQNLYEGPKWLLLSNQKSESNDSHEMNKGTSISSPDKDDLANILSMTLFLAPFHEDDVPEDAVDGNDIGKACRQDLN